MATRRPMVNMQIDARGAAAALGAVEGIVQTIKTNRYTGSVLTMAHALMAEEFDRSLDTIAPTQRKRYHHVYEWDQVGNPEAKLWKHTLLGSGAVRTASFQFLPSKTPVPTPQERKNDPNDPTHLVPQDVIDRLSNRTYYFHWKAQVMEYKIPVVVTPKYSTRLFVPAGNNPDRMWYFSNGPIRITNSGGDETTGAFTAFWVQWWAMSAERVFKEKVQTVIEKDLGKTPVEAAANRYRSSSKKVGLFTVADSDIAFEEGRKLAEAYLLGKAKSYEAAKTYILENS